MKDARGRFRVTAGRLARGLFRLLYRGSRLTCPVCDKRYRRFRSYGVVRRRDSLCPNCGSLERHRLLQIYLQRETDIFSGHYRVLHCSPEPCLERRLAGEPGLEYVSADIVPSRALVQADITDMPFGDGSFDVVICFHVLEHVGDDVKAMGELYRVLKPGGWGIIQSPVDPRLEKTCEDAGIVSPADREKAYGNRDHVRMYGRDFRTRLEGAGFRVEVIDYAERLSGDEIERYALGTDTVIYACGRPPRTGRPGKDGG